MKFEKMKWDIQRITWTAAKDLAVAAASTTYPMPLPGGTGYLLGLEGRVTTAFSGITGPVKMKVGFTNIPDVLLRAVDIGVAKDLYGSGSTAAHFFCASRDSLYETGLSPIITFESSSGNLEDLTAGEVELVVIYLVPDV
jgi:hypothetical protein